MIWGQPVDGSVQNRWITGGLVENVQFRACVYFEALPVGIGGAVDVAHRRPSARAVTDDAAGPAWGLLS